MANTKRKRRNIRTKKCYKVPHLVRGERGNDPYASTRALLRSIFHRELEAAYGE